MVLPALIYCYAVDFFVEKWKLRKAAYCCIPVLLAMLLWRAEFCRFFGGFYHTMEYRNFLFTGFGFYLTGQMIHEYQDKMYQCFVQKHTERHIKWLLIVGMAAGAALSILEYSFQNAREIYLGNCIAVILPVFMACLIWQRKENFTDTGGNRAKVRIFDLSASSGSCDIIKKIFAVCGN